MGSNLKLLIDRPDDPHVFRLHRDRVFYVSERTSPASTCTALTRSAVMKLAASVARPNLIGLGVCLGKFSKTGKFRLHVTSLDYLAKYAKHKVRFAPFDVLALRLARALERLERDGVRRFLIRRLLASSRLVGSRL